MLRRGALAQVRGPKGDRSLARPRGEGRWTSSGSASSDSATWGGNGLPARRVGLRNGGVQPHAIEGGGGGGARRAGGGLPGGRRPGAEVLMLSLANQDAVREVLFGEDGAARCAPEGSYIVDMSTVPPDFARELAATAPQPAPRARCLRLRRAHARAQRRAAGDGRWRRGGFPRRGGHPRRRSARR